MRSISFGIFRIVVNYLMKPKGRHTWHYRRSVPKDLRQHYSQPTIFKSLRTKDEKMAAVLCASMDRQYEMEFSRLRRGLPKRPAPAKHQLGTDKLMQFGIDLTVTDEGTVQHADRIEPFETHIMNLLHDAVGVERMNEIHYRNEPLPVESLPVAERTAYELLTDVFDLTASEYPKEYINLKRREGDRKFETSVNAAIDFLLKYLPDKAPRDYRRYEIRQLIDGHLSAGLKTTTVKRRLNTLRAMFNKVALERDLQEDLNHPFKNFDIPNLGEDSVDRSEFTRHQLALLRQAEPAYAKEIMWLIHLMLDTGLRINECCGLRRLDVAMGDQPCLIVHKNSFRRLKTKNSQRIIPLVGSALSSIREALELEDAKKKEWLFPRYVDDVKQTTKNDSASGAVNKRLKALLGEDAPTCHGFRHTMQARLRNVSCPQDVRDELGGWRKTVSEQYGSPTDIRTKAQYLRETIDVDDGLTFRRD